MAIGSFIGNASTWGRPGHVVAENGDYRVEYEGAVLQEFERNGYDDFYNGGTSHGVPLYESVDCSGPPRLATGSPLVIPHAFVRGTTAYYRVVGPITERLIRSSLFLDDSEQTCTQRPGVFTSPDCCVSNGAGSLMPTYDVGVLELDSLGLVPPFHVELQ